MARRQREARRRVASLPLDARVCAPRARGRQPQRQPCRASPQPHPAAQVRQAHVGPATCVAEDVAAALQPHWHAAPAQSTHWHEGEVESFMAISCG